MMHRNNSNGNRAACARGFVALCAVLAIVMACSRPGPPPAGPFAYVTDGVEGTVSVIDTATTPPSVVGTPIPVGRERWGIAITPDGKHAYVVNTSDGTVSVIDTAANNVAATIPLGTNTGPSAVVVTPDGKHAYVTNRFSNSVSVIDTATTPPIGGGHYHGGD